MDRIHLRPATLCLLWLVSCGRLNPGPSGIEAVLSEGMRVTAATPNGTISIHAGKGLTRHISSDGWSRTSVLTPRTARWSGSLGGYDPAPGFSLWDRLIVEEGRQFFSSESEVLRYLQFLSAYFGELTYSDRGLVLAYKVIDIPNEKPTRSIALWQLYIRGSKPSLLPGGSNRIEVLGGFIPEEAAPVPAPEGYPRELADKEYRPRLR